MAERATMVSSTIRGAWSTPIETGTELVFVARATMMSSKTRGAWSTPIETGTELLFVGACMRTSECLDQPRSSRCETFVPANAMVCIQS